MAGLLSMAGGLFSAASSLIGGVGGIASTAASLALNKQQYKAAQQSYDWSTEAAKASQYELTTLANTEYYYNKEQLASTYYDNLQLNYSKAAADMWTITNQYVDAASKVTLAYANQGGIGFNSGNNDSQRALQKDFNMAINDVEVGRDWTEDMLIDEYQNNVFQQDIDYYKNITNINLAYQNADLAASQNLLNASVGYSSNNYNSLFGANSSLNLGSIFDTVSSGANYISRVIGG